MKTVKDIVLTIAFLWFAIIAIFTLLGEPTPGSMWDSFWGILLMKFVSLVHIILCAESWRKISKEFRDKLENYFKQ